MRANATCLRLCLSALPLLPLLSGAICTSTEAQSAPELPQASPKARVEQRVGLTDFSLDYSSPAVKARPIWGSLVAYDKPWRTGANAATTLTASREFTFGGKVIPAGKYALYTIPGKTQWVVALSSKTSAWGDGDYDAKQDVARVTVKPSAATHRERLTFLFDATTDAGTQLVLEWEKLRVAVPLVVDTKTQANANIQKAAEDGWRSYSTSARYLLENGGDLELALRYADQSIAIKPTWSNHWVRAQLLQKKGQPKEALASAEKTLQLGNGDRVFDGFYRADVTKSVTEWKK
ncbi:MAG: DUF2911 domain-containing protein [Polyangiales bacterium]